MNWGELLAKESYLIRLHEMQDRTLDTLLHPLYIKTYIENETIYGFSKLYLKKTTPEGKLCKEIIKHVANLYVRSRTLKETAKRLNVKHTLLREFLLEADRLKVIDYKSLKSESKNALTPRNIEELKRVKEVYDRRKSLQRAGDEFHILLHPSHIKKYIENETIYEFPKVNESTPEGRLCKGMIECVADQHTRSRTLKETAKRLNVKHTLLREFLLEADRLRAIDHKESLVTQAAKCLKEHYSITKVAKSMKMSRMAVKSLLFDKYGCNNVVELRKTLRLEKCISQKQIRRLKGVKEVYDKSLSLQEAADELHITRERVRQLLQQGVKHGLFTYETHRKDRLEKKLEEVRIVKRVYDRCLTLRRTANELRITRNKVKQLLQVGDRHGLFRHEEMKRLEELRQQYDRKTLIKEIRRHISRSQICLELGMTETELHKLLEYFNIDFHEYLNSARMTKCLEQYSYIVDTLGHHPTTTEMGSRKDWRLVWAKIDRLWGNMDNFRKEFGIEKPKYRTLAAKRKRQAKKERMVSFIRKNGPVGSKRICDEFGIYASEAWHYTVELLREGIVVKLGKGSQVKYGIKKG